MNDANDRRLFWACFVALVTTAFGFIIRALIMDDWQRQFGLSETQKGEIFGVGLWPFAISIVLFSLIIDKIGYGRAMVFAFICHVASAVVTVFAPSVLAPVGSSPEELAVGQRLGYWMLYAGNFIVALGNGTVEAVINPVVATMFPREKTKWLNILHAGWPGGLVIGGLLTISLSSAGIIGRLFPDLISWQWKVGLILLPTVIYGFMMLGCRFPVNERVAAGVTYRDMLKEFGVLGAIIVVSLMIREVGRVFEMSTSVQLALGAALVIGFFAIAPSLGRPMFAFLLLIMIPLATTELGTDSWITDLLKPETQKLGVDAGWILVYTSFIMMVLRFFAGPVVHKLSPLGLLAICSAIAAVGLVALSQSTGFMILAAATLYGVGKTFFWPTMLGVVSEQFPKGGALTLNATGGVGMLGVGVVGAAFLGYFQDTAIDRHLANDQIELRAQITEPKQSVFGEYNALIPEEVRLLTPEQRAGITQVELKAKKSALAIVAIFPCIMLACYLVLIAYFRARGGYKAEVLTGHAAEDEKFTGGVPGPMEA